MRTIEEHFPTADRYVLFTGHLSEGNLRLYNKLAQTEPWPPVSVSAFYSC